VWQVLKGTYLPGKTGARQRVTPKEEEESRQPVQRGAYKKKKKKKTMNKAKKILKASNSTNIWSKYKQGEA